MKCYDFENFRISLEISTDIYKYSSLIYYQYIHLYINKYIYAYIYLRIYTPKYI